MRRKIVFQKIKEKGYNHKNDELGINKNKSINYFRNRNNYQYNTINIQEENKYKENKDIYKYNKYYINKPKNIKKSFSQINNQFGNYLYIKEKIRNNNIKNFDNLNEKNFYKYNMSSNNTESYNNHRSLPDNLSSKKMFIYNNNNKENAKSLMNIFYNENDTGFYKPKIYKNKKYIKNIFNSRNKEEINQKI